MRKGSGDRLLYVTVPETAELGSICPCLGPLGELPAASLSPLEDPEWLLSSWRAALRVEATPWSPAGPMGPCLTPQGPVEIKKGTGFQTHPGPADQTAEDRDGAWV